MNKYALAADSRTWWLPSAVAGAIGAAALGAILILPANATAAPVRTTPDVPAGSVHSGTDVSHACFMHRPPANDAVEPPPYPDC